MFQILPVELQSLVYDRLLIQDKVNMRIALGKSCEIKKNVTKEKKLGLIKYIFKHPLEFKPEKSRKVMEFITEHWEDPTVQDVVGKKTNIFRFFAMIRSGNIDLNKVEPFSEDDESLCKELLAFDEFYKPSVLETIWQNPDKFMVLKRYIEFTQQNYLFNCVNNKNAEMVKYIKDNLYKYNFVKAYEYIQHIAPILAYSKETLSILLKYFDLPEERLDEIAKQAVTSMNFRILEMPEIKASLHRITLNI